MNRDSNVYQRLVQRERERALLGSCANLLGWDERTIMPSKGVGMRGDQLALLARLSHAHLTHPETGELILQAESLAFSTDSIESANVRGIRRAYDRAVKIPPDLVEAITKATSIGQNAWVEAKANNDFASFAPHLETIFRLKREEAAAIGYTEHPYDALLEEFEPGARTTEIRKVLEDLVSELSPLVQEIMSSGVKPKTDLLHQSFPVPAQEKLSRQVAEAVGFDFEAGRIDVTAHPFCSGIAPGDCRITTRYNPNYFSESFFGTLHEAGHGMYEQRLNHESFGLPVGTACSLGIHESQSRLWENLVGRSRGFWDWCFPLARSLFPEALGSVTLNQWYPAINAVSPSLIRIEADEVTYNLHIILRFELEVALLTGDLAVRDLPDAWKNRFRSIFHLEVPDDAHGCLQDIHWSAGLVGYFPTYTLGNLYASQFLESAKMELGNLTKMFRQGIFTPLTEWMQKNIHSQGQRYLAPELCRNITGKNLSSAALMQHLRGKYREIYS